MAEEHDEAADAAEQQADELGEQSDKLEKEIEDTRSDFESKIGDQQAPGLQDEGSAAPGGYGVEEDEESTS